MRVWDIHGDAMRAAERKTVDMHEKKNIKISTIWYYKSIACVLCYKNEQRDTTGILFYLPSARRFTECFLSDSANQLVPVVRRHRNEFKW
jgi:hypothetical protein